MTSTVLDHTRFSLSFFFLSLLFQCIYMHVCEYSHAYTFSKEVVQCHVDFFPSNSHHTPGQIPHNVSKLEQFSPYYLVCGHIFPGNRQTLEQTFSLNSTIRIHSWKINTPFTERVSFIGCVCCITNDFTKKKNWAWLLNLWVLFNKIISHSY